MSGRECLYRLASATLCASFALVGLLFLLLPDAVLTLFDGWSRGLGLATLDGPADPFFVVLAAAYMYVVTALAWSMWRNPRDAAAPGLLAQAKFASALLSLAAFFLRRPLLILLVNGLVDGAIGVFVLFLRRGLYAPDLARRA